MVLVKYRPRGTDVAVSWDNFSFHFAADKIRHLRLVLDLDFESQNAFSDEHLLLESELVIDCYRGTSYTDTQCSESLVWNRAV